MFKLNAGYTTINAGPPSDITHWEYVSLSTRTSQVLTKLLKTDEKQYLPIHMTD